MNIKSKIISTKMFYWQNINTFRTVSKILPTKTIFYVNKDL